MSRRSSRSFKRKSEDRCSEENQEKRRSTGKMTQESIFHYLKQAPPRERLPLRERPVIVVSDDSESSEMMLDTSMVSASLEQSMLSDSAVDLTSEMTISDSPQSPDASPSHEDTQVFVNEPSTPVTVTSQPSSQYEAITPLPKPPEPRTMSAIRLQVSLPRMGGETPLPRLPWANREDVWNNMLRKEQVYRRDPEWSSRHIDIQPSMRAVLLDWLSEVCDVYKLHRETFHLAVDYLDRFLSTASGLQKNNLQLIGVTSLFIAAKNEEIYPPKLSEFAFVTDKACSEDDITQQELVILERLEWKLCPHTSLNWLSVFLNVVNTENLTDLSYSFILPQYPQEVFINMARLLDLCVLDCESLSYNYCQLAAAALCHMTSEALTLRVTNYEMEDFRDCYDWMVPHMMVLREFGRIAVDYQGNMDDADAHNIHKHNVHILHLNRTEKIKEQITASGRASPPKPCNVLITPPTSGKCDTKSS